MTDKTTHPDSRKRIITETLSGALGVAVLFLPWHLLLCMVSWAIGDFLNSLLLPFAAAVLTGILTAGIVYSPTAGRGAAKLLCSAPFTVLYFELQVRHDLHARALNYVILGYGHISAGGAYAAVFLLGCLALGMNIGALTALSYSSNDKRSAVWHGLQIVAYSCCGLMTAAVIVLDITMPLYRSG